jgi:hypothetical protein
MKVQGINGRAYKLSLGGRDFEIDRKVSSLHSRARDLLRQIFPFEPRKEEVSLPGCKAQLYLDFFLPQSMFAVEVQGQQHYEHTPLFHGTDKFHFYASLARDNEKRSFCGLNKITLVELPYNESDEQWEKRIREAG